MQSRTSCFNGGIFRKDAGRFWPIWGAYLGIWLLMLPLVILSNRYRYQMNPALLREFLLNMGYYGGMIMSAVFGVFSAMAVWSFAYSSRSANAMGCLPVRREGVYTASMLAGLLPYLAANVLLALLALLAELAGGAVDLGATLQCLALMSLPFLLFYGFATFCAQLTGNILVLPAVYAVLNVVFVAVEFLVRGIVSEFVFGLTVEVDRFVLRWLSPAAALLMECHVRRDAEWDAVAEKLIEQPYCFRGWGIYLAYAAAGLALLGLALLLFRRRRMETAGDVVAVSVLKPVFRWCMAIGCALCTAGLYYLIFEITIDRNAASRLMGTLISLWIGAFLGWFIAEMLMKKSFRVFRKRWGGLGLCCALLALLLCTCEFDLLGVERWVPAEDHIVSASVVSQGERAELREPESIALVTGLHRSIIENRAWHREPHYWTEDRVPFYDAYVTLEYTLRGGRNVTRQYYIYSFGTAPESYGDVGLLQDVLNCREAIRTRNAPAFPLTAENLELSEVTAVMPVAACAAAAGYASAEEYVLREHCGLSSSDLNELEPEDRAALVQQGLLKGVQAGEVAGYYYDYADGVPKAVAVEDKTWNPEELKLDETMFDYHWKFTDAQMMELYETCILPDLAEQRIGQTVIIEDEEWNRRAYAVDVTLRAAEDVGGNLGTQWVYLSFIPTTDSVRTNAWLTAHGVTLLTRSEIE